MTQVSRFKMDKEVADTVAQVFLETMVKIKDKKVARDVLSELLSKTEIIMLSKRLAIVYLLEKNYSQREISRVLKVSLATVAKMNAIARDETGIYKIIKSILMDEEVKLFFHSLDMTLSKIIIPKIGRRHKMNEF